MIILQHSLLLWAGRETRTDSIPPVQVNYKIRPPIQHEVYSTPHNALNCSLGTVYIFPSKSQAAFQVSAASYVVQIELVHAVVCAVKCASIGCWVVGVYDLRFPAVFCMFV